MDRIACIGLNEPDVEAIKAQYHGPVLVYDVPPKMFSDLGSLYAESPTISGKWLLVEKVVWYGYYPVDTRAPEARRAIALSHARSFPDMGRAILHDDRALSLIQAVQADPGQTMNRGYLSLGSQIFFDKQRVLKVGNEHCGDGKSLIEGAAEGQFSGVLEPFFQGEESVRVLLMGHKAWVLKYESTVGDWRQNVQPKVTEVHAAKYPMLMPRARALGERIGLPALGVDFIGSNAGGWNLLEVNAYPGLDDVVEAQETFRELLCEFVS